MSIKNNQFYEALEEKRPELSKNSLKTYSSILYNLFLKMFGESPIKIAKFKNVKSTLKALEDTPISTRKTILSALYVLTEKEEYKNAMMSDIIEYDNEIDKQEKTETQKSNWANKEDILKKLEELKLKSDLEYRGKGGVQEIQNYIILCLLGGVYIPPRRAKDYTDMKINNINKKTDNYIRGNKLYFNSYKGSDKKGTQIIEIPTDLKKILSKWIKINKNDYLLYDKNNNKLSSVKLNQRLNKIFNSKISINALRHTFLTDKHKKNLESYQQLQDDMKMMGSSILQAKTYIKN